MLKAAIICPNDFLRRELQESLSDLGQASGRFGEVRAFEESSPLGLFA